MSNTSLRSLKAVVVEDSKTQREMICFVLNNCGLPEVFVAGDGREALDLIEKHNPSIILVDWEMPKMDGIELTRHVRHGHGSIDRDTPIVMVTGVKQDGADRQAYDAGVDVFITKPFNMKNLFDGVQKALTRNTVPLP